MLGKQPLYGLGKQPVCCRVRCGGDDGSVVVVMVVVVMVVWRR